jgi:hypothetical protein
MNRRPTWILLGLFIALLITAWLMQSKPFGKLPTPTVTPGLASLFDLQANPVIFMRISDASGRAVTVEKDANGKWMLIEPASQSADVERIQTAVIRAQGVSIITKLDDTPDLKAIGMDPPTYRIELKLADGQKQVAFIGNLTAIGSGYYAHLDGAPLYIVNKYGVEGMLDIFKTLPIPPTPTVEVPVEVTPEPTATIVP